MKRKIVRILVYLVLLAVVASAVIFGILLYQESSNRDPYTVIPNDAVFVLHTDNLSKGWEEITHTKFWKTLLQTEKYQSISNTANSLDSIINNNKTVYRLLEDRPVMVSAHMTTAYDYDMLFTVDLLKASKVVFLRDFAIQILKLYGYDFVKLEYNENQLIEIINKDDGNSFYLSFIENIMVISYSQEVIKKALDQDAEKSLLQEGAFLKARNNISNIGLLRFYFNYNKLEDFIRGYQDPDDYKALIESMASAGFTAFDLDVTENTLLLEGHTSYRDSISPFMKTAKQVSAAKPEAFKLVPMEAVFYLSFAFKDFEEVYKTLHQSYKKRDSVKYASFEKSINQINRVLNTDMEEHLTSWIGNEIALLKLQPGQKTSIRNAVICIHAGDINEARQSLDNLNEKVKKNLPAGFDVKNYLGYDIHYLNISGVFRFLFSDLLSRIDKPYFTYIGDYVIFSNDISNIYSMVDAYLKEQTLLFDDEYMDFVSQINSRSPLSVYIQTPNALNLLYAHANPSTKEKISENIDVIASFSRIGIQFNPGSETIETNIIVDHDVNAMYKTMLRELESEATDLYSTYLQRKDFAFEIPEEHEKNSTFTTLYYADSVTVKARGKLRRGRLHEQWRLFYPGGNIKAILPYDKGKVDGRAFFYYDAEGQPLLCEAEFDNDELEGSYKEYYKNGKLKAELQFDNNEEDGEVKFYYLNGNLQIEGEYRKGSKKGSWKYYAPDGELYDRKHWRRSKKQG